MIDSSEMTIDIIDHLKASRQRLMEGPDTIHIDQRTIEIRLPRKCEKDPYQDLL